MADQPSVRIPLPGEVPFIPQTPEQAAERDAMSLGQPEQAPQAVAMSVGSPAADDALLAALEAAHSFISRTVQWKGQEDEKEQVLALTTAALDAIVPPTP